MGNNIPQNQTQTSLENFPMQRYLNQGLNQNEIIKIKQAFDSYGPINGYINLTKLKNCTQRSNSKQKIDKYLGNKSQMNFDQFFVMSKDLIQEQIKSNPTIILDTNEVQSTCLFCPYAQDTK